MEICNSISKKEENILKEKNNSHKGLVWSTESY